MPQSFPENPNRRSVANRTIRARLLAALERLGEIEGTDAAAAVAFDPEAVRRRRMVSKLRPTRSQESSTRRALASLKAAGLVVGAGRRRRLKVYRLASDLEELEGLCLGTFDG
jgi:hypothetical protein